MQLRPRKYKELGWGIQGPRGAGKDALGCYLACVYMLAGVTCYSNTPIEATWEEGHVKTENLFTSQLFTMGKSFVNAEGEEVEGFKPDCLVYISEMDKLVHKFRRMSNVNRLLSTLATQIRKDGISFVGTAQDWFWVDPDWVFQTDVLINCSDLHFSEFGFEENVPEGYVSYIELFDLSGAITGHRYKDTGQPYDAFNFNTRKMWDPAVNGGQGPLYDSYKSYGLEDILTKVVLDKKERHIGVASEGTTSIEDRNISDYTPRSPANAYIQGVLESMRGQGKSQITQSEIRSILVSAGYRGDMRVIGRHIDKLGFHKIKANEGEDVYEIPQKELVPA